MGYRKRIRSGFLSRLIGSSIVGALFIAGCQPAAEEAPPFELRAADKCTFIDPPTERSEGAPAEVTFPRTGSEQLYFEGQVLVTGVPVDIDAVIGGISGINGFVDQIALEYAVLEGQNVWPTGDGTPPVVRLYVLDPGMEVLEAIQQIYQAANPDPEDGEGTLVFADPNFVLTNRTHGIVGSPDGLEPGAGVGELSSQWALDRWEENGEILGGIELIGNEDETAGSGVEIVVFDSTPFAKAGTWQVARQEFAHSLEFCVSLPSSPYMVQWESENASAIAEDVFTDQVQGGVEHGLFVSGLAKTIAPGSQVHMVRVMDDGAEGDMFTLIKAMSAYLNQKAKVGGPAVLNLSLGFHLDAGTMWGEVDEYVRVLALINELLQLYMPGSPPFGADEVAIVGLRLPFWAAEQFGFVVVAAAGNTASAANPLGHAHYPAMYGEALAVGASDSEGGEACFSNPADVLAPGGKADKGQCELGSDHLTSLVVVNRHASGYGKWTGTSFSTAQVSGLAARLLGLPASAHPDMSPETVRCLITQSPVDEHNVVNIPKALSHAMDDSVCP